ncbi:hypothetical protein ACO2WT_09015, partial [Ligilactobacillus salivarius]
MKIFILEDDSLQILRLKLVLESIQPNLVIQTFKESDKLLQHITQPGQLPQSKDMGLVTHDLTVSGNNATSL